MRKIGFINSDSAASTLLEALVSVGIAIVLLTAFLFSTNDLYTVQQQPGVDLEAKSIGLMETLIFSPGTDDSFYPEWQNSSENLKDFGLSTSQTVQYGIFKNTTSEVIDGPYSNGSIGDSNTCFLAGTKIVMSDKSYKNIEDIQIGDIVKSYDIVNNKIVDKRVITVFHHSPEEMGDYYLIINDQLRVTPNHEFYIGGKWIYAENLIIGDKLFYPSTDYEVYSLEKVFEKVFTYNFEVEGNHNYFVAMEPTDILVHNLDGIPGGGTPSHPVVALPTFDWTPTYPIVLEGLGALATFNAHGFNHEAPAPNGFPTRYEYDWGDGNYVTVYSGSPKEYVNNIGHTFTHSGSYNVKLRVTYSCSKDPDCTATRAHTVTVIDPLSITVDSNHPFGTSETGFLFDSYPVGGLLPYPTDAFLWEYHDPELDDKPWEEIWWPFNGHEQDTASYKFFNAPAEGVLFKTIDIRVTVTDGQPKNASGTCSIDIYQVGYNPPLAPCFTWCDADGPNGIPPNNYNNIYVNPSCTIIDDQWEDDIDVIWKKNGAQYGVTSHSLSPIIITNTATSCTIQLCITINGLEMTRCTSPITVHTNNPEPIIPDSQPWVLTGKQVYFKDIFEGTLDDGGGTRDDGGMGGVSFDSVLSSSFPMQISIPENYYVKYTQPNETEVNYSIFELKDKVDPDHPILDYGKISKLSDISYDNLYLSIKNALGLVSDQIVYNFKIAITIYNPNGTINDTINYGAIDDYVSAKKSITKQVLVYYPPTAKWDSVTWIIDSHPKYLEADITVYIFMGGTPP